MQFRKVDSGSTLCLWALLCAGIAFWVQPAAGQATLVIRGAKVYPISGPPIEHGVLLAVNGKIVAVGEEGKVKIPRGATVEDATGKVVMPGIVDSHSHIGIIANRWPRTRATPMSRPARLSPGCAPSMPLIPPTRISAWPQLGASLLRTLCRVVEM